MSFNLYAVKELLEENASLRAELEQITRPEIVRCKDCRWRDKGLCRASKSIKYDLRREKYTYKTVMEPDGFCHIGEPFPQKEVNDGQEQV